MAKVIEFYVQDLFPTKVKSVPRDQLGRVIEFPKNKAAVASNTPKTPDAMEVTLALPLSRDFSKVARNFFGTLPFLPIRTALPPAYG